MGISITDGPYATYETPSWNERFLQVIPDNFDSLKLCFDELLGSETFKKFFDEQDKQRYFDLLKYFVNESKTEQEIIEFFFLTEDKLNEEEINIKNFSEMWGNQHRLIYNEYIEENLQFIIENGVIVLDSCMYAGKTTFAFQLIDKLKEQNYEVQYLVADALGVDKITARALNREEDAIPFPKGIKNFGSLFKSDTKKCIFLDEYTFVGSERMNVLIDYCKDNGILLILAGLDKTSNSESLIDPEVTKKLKDINALNYQCLAFLPNQTDFSDDQYSKPAGRFTQRFVQIKGNPKLFLRDILFAEAVIAKENPFVIYRPTDEDQIEIMEKAGAHTPEIDELKIARRKAHFKYCKENFAAAA